MESGTAFAAYIGGEDGAASSVDLEFDVAAVFKKQLEVFGIQPELTEIFADLVCGGPGGRSSGPAIISAGMFEFEEAAVVKLERAAVELAVHVVPYDSLFRVLGKAHNRR